MPDKKCSLCHHKARTLYVCAKCQKQVCENCAHAIQAHEGKNIKYSILCDPCYQQTKLHP